jgi:hypothetical protein
LIDLLRGTGTNKSDVDPKKDEEKDRRNEQEGFDLQAILPFNRK